MKIEISRHDQLLGLLAGMRQDRQPYWTLWRELADYYLPRRYVWLQSDQERRVKNARNPHILDSTGTVAARTLAAGMLNGITSPSRPWFRLRVPGFEFDEDSEVNVWLDEVTRRMLVVMAESNFYNALAIMYLDLVVFGTAAMLIYEDDESVLRAYNPALGEYYLSQSDRQQVNGFGREFTYLVHQVVERWGIENVSEATKDLYNRKDGSRYQPVKIAHVILPNTDRDLPRRFSHVEYYWELGTEKGTVLERRGFNELPGLFPRWEVSANDAYGMCPAMEALGDVIQLQQETKRKAQGLDKMISPPILADMQLRNTPTSLLPNGVTYVTNLREGNVGARPMYTVQLPLQELTADIREVQGRVREVFHNDLFMMISQLDTVRSATEIDARREEKLVMLGSVLERFESEALDPAIERVFNIMLRNRLLPEAPPQIAGQDINVQYVSILATAQRAVQAIPTERWMTMIANIAPVYPKAVNIPDWEQLLRDYGRDIGVPAKLMVPREMSEAAGQQMDELAQAREAAAVGKDFTAAAKQLGETPVGGGAGALQAMLGG